MTTLERVQTYLTRMNCAFEHDQHELAYTAREVAHIEHISERTFAKSVIVHSETGFAMCVLPADRLVDLEQLRTTFGFHRLRLATESEIGDLFPDCELGAMPPFGTLYNLPVYVDESLAKDREVVFNAGTHHDAVRMAYEDFVRLASPQVCSFT